MLEPVELIEVARHVADRGTPDALRRAVSTAYYALFHAVAGSAADRFVGPGDTSAAYAMVYRSFDHTGVRTVLVEFRKSTLKASYQKALKRSAMSVALQKFVDVFISLQELRSLADYDPFLPPLSPKDVRDLIDEAASAIRDFATLDPVERTDVLALMIAGARA